MIEFKGKVLLRRATTCDGQPVLVLCGVVEPNVPVENFSDGDEMWAAHLEVRDALKFVNPCKHNFSPEDFLANASNMQDISNWKAK